MNTAIAAAAAPTIATLTKLDPYSSAFVVAGREGLALKAGTNVAVEGFTWSFAVDTPVVLPPLQAGCDYAVHIDVAGAPLALLAPSMAAVEGAIGGFHFAPGGNAPARAGGDDVPAINPFSCWDLNFRPACPDPRGMTLVDGRFWADIYLLGIDVDHLDPGTSRCGEAIADGSSPPYRPEEGGRRLTKTPPRATYKRFDYTAAVEVMAFHGKQLLGAEEFFAFAHGVTERTAINADPKVTGLDAPRTSKWGGMQATGSMWQWGTDGDPDAPRASIFGGSWFGGGYAGSRCAPLARWAEYSGGDISARGRSDHLMRV